jgi:hypothetical protein
LGDVGKVWDDKYLNYLNSFVGYLNCSSIYAIDNAKAFEIMASGGILITNKCDNGFLDLFSKNSFITYESDSRDLLSKVNAIISDSDFRKSILDSASIDILNHSHEIRANQFVDTLNKLIYCNVNNKNNTNLIQTIHKKHLELDAKSNVIVSEKKEVQILKSPEELIQKLIDNKIEFCLLGASCYSLVLEHKLDLPLHIGVKILDLPKVEKLMYTERVVVQAYMGQTKEMSYNNYKLKVPFPVVPYLNRIYNIDCKEILAKKR